MRAVFFYGATAALVVAALAAAGAWLIPGAEPSALVLAAGVAWLVQLLAFGALLLGRRGPGGFLASWAAGMGLRFAVVVGVAFWVTRTAAYDAPTTLVGLVAFVFVLVLLEPLFLRLAD